MKILILANHNNGLYLFRRELIVGLLAENEVYIAAPGGERVGDFESMGCVYIDVEFERRGKNPFGDLTLLRTYLRLLREIRPDVALTYTIKPNVYGGIACALRKVPFLANVTGLGTSLENGGLLAFVTKTLYRIGLSRAACVFFQNEPNQRLFREGKLYSGRSRVIPGSGVSLTANPLEPYPSEDGGLRFIFIGRVMRDKGIGEYLEAAERVREKHPDTEFLIAGRSDEDYTERLADAQKRGIVNYLGFRSNIHALTASCHCAVLPSYHEGTANVLLEAESTGRPVVATRVTGCAGTYIDGVSGFGCEVRSADSLTEALERFIALPHAEKAEMGLAGRRYVAEKYDRRIVVEAYMQELGRCGAKNEIKA